MALIALGFIGTLLGNLIKAAVSRQRERFPDASGVQFTRNPLGLAGALKRIGALEFGSKLADRTPRKQATCTSPKACGAGSRDSGPPTLRSTNGFVNSTHTGTGRFLPLYGAAAEIAAELSADFVGSSLTGGRQTQRSAAARRQKGDGAYRKPTAAHHEYAASLLSTIPQQLIDACADRCARAIVLALLIHAEPSLREQQLRELSQIVKNDVYTLVQKLLPLIDGVHPAARLPLVDPALPALAAMSPAQHAEFRTGFKTLTHADGQLDLFEWMLGQVVQRHLRPKFESIPARRIRQTSSKKLSYFSSPWCCPRSPTPTPTTRQRKTHSRPGRARMPELKLSRAPARDVRSRIVASSYDGPAIRFAGRPPTIDPRLRRRHRRRRPCECAGGGAAGGIADLLGCPMPPLLAGEVAEQNSRIESTSEIRVA